MYNQKNLKLAITHAENLKADLGGTELYAPLEAIFKTPFEEEYPRQVFILTDGAISNTQNTLDLVKKECATTRVFSLGIGRGASRPLVQGLALSGRGLAMFVDEGENETMKVKVLNMLKSALEPIFRKCEIDWPLKSLNASSSHQFPAKIRPIFNGERLVATCLISGITGDLPDSLVIPLR